jgi:hypothetical protein
MHHKKKSLIVCTVILLLVTLSLISQPVNGANAICFQIHYPEHTEQITLWENTDGKFYVFLPSNVELGEVEICLNTATPVSINGEPLTDGMTCVDFNWNDEYSYTYATFGKKQHGIISFLHSSSLPTIYLDTQSASMEYIHNKKGNQESGEIRVYTAEGDLNYLGLFNSIRGRGNDTWVSYSKKPYSIDFAQTVDLLNMGAADNWILLANASDPSQMRNKLGFFLADKLGIEFTPDTQWVDLYLNGEYAGVYLLSERNEIANSRINIPETDGILVSLELKERLQTQDDPYIVTAGDQALRVHHGDPKTAMKIFQSIENAIAAEDGIDPETGKHYLEMIDIDSWAKKYLIEECLGNLDACCISQYFYCNPMGQVYAGPVWDLDLSMGNQSKWQLINTSAIFANRLEVKENVSALWMYSLCQKEVFWNRVIEIYQQTLKSQLSGLVDNVLEQYQQELHYAAKLNQIRWGDTQNIEDEAAYIQNYLKSRADFLENFWFGKEEFCIVRINDGMNSNYAYVAVPHGTKLTQLPVLDIWGNLQFDSWYDAKTDTIYDASQLVFEDVEIYAGWIELPRVDQGKVLKLVPLAVIMIIGLLLLFADYMRIKKDGAPKQNINNIF